jgi:predicted kinase
MISNYSVQSKFGEHVLDRMFRELLHSSLALEAFVHRITHMAGLKNTANNIANRTGAYDLGF